MGKATYGTGTLFKRGRIWYLSYYVDGQQVVRSSRSSNLQDAKQLRDQILGKKARGELAEATGDNVTCGELLDDLLEHARANLKPSTERIFRWCIEANIRPSFGHLKASRLTTKTLKDYRQKRLAEGRAESTCNRELSILTIALNLGRKCTPPKVTTMLHFPMVREVNARQGFLNDQQYAKLRDVLPDYLKPLFVVAYFTGVRLGELLAWTWDKVDFNEGFITLHAGETKSGYSRAVPIIDGDMRKWLEWSRDNADGCERVFHRDGSPIKHFRAAWKTACPPSSCRPEVS
jgi:integrase